MQQIFILQLITILNSSLPDKMFQSAVIRTFKNICLRKTCSIFHVVFLIYIRLFFVYELYSSIFAPTSHGG